MARVVSVPERAGHPWPLRLDGWCLPVAGVMSLPQCLTDGVETGEEYFLLTDEERVQRLTDRPVSGRDRRGVFFCRNYTHH